MSQPFYRAFEDRYRGARDTIKERLRAYVPFLQPIVARQPAAAALDLGCGRGEWLELLGEHGFAARGIDLDDGMLAACRERNLNVQNMDALAALRACPDASLALVSSFHLVEHLPFDVVQEVIAEALRALQPGGLLVMETPNPENLTVGATTFYMDPTHVHPLPPNLLSFATEHAGFARSKVVRLQEHPRLHEDPPLGLIDVLEGVSMDYAVVAQKAAAPEMLAPFDAAFAHEYGIGLGTLAGRYDLQRDERHAGIHQILGRLDAQAGTAGHRLGEVQQQLQHVVRQVDELSRHAERQEARLAAAEARADEMTQRVVALLTSTSWRVTAPLRFVVSVAHVFRHGGRRIVSAQREGRLVPGLKRRTRTFLHRLGGFMLRQKRLKRVVRGLLRYTPALQARLYKMMLDNNAALATPLDDGGGALSPRAARVLRELQALQAKEQDAHRR